MTPRFADVIDRVAMLEMSGIVGLGHPVRSMEFPSGGAQECQASQLIS